MGEEPDITQLLRELSQGRRDALDRLMPIVYHELRRIAHGQLRRERPGHTLNTTALVHEAYLKLVNIRQVEWRDPAPPLPVGGRGGGRGPLASPPAPEKGKSGGGAGAVAPGRGRGVP